MTDQTPTPSGEADVRAEIGRIAILLFETWKRVDPRSDVALHPTSYIATFTDMARAVFADRATRPAAADVEVRQLEWIGIEKNGKVKQWTAQTGLYQGAEYEVWGGEGAFKVAFDGLLVKSGLNSPDLAKAAAQADYERRIRPNLAAAGEPNREEIQGEVGKEFGARPAAAGVGVRTVTDEMVEAACRGYWPSHWPKHFAHADADSIRNHMRDALSAALATPVVPADAGEPVAKDAYELALSHDDEGSLLTAVFDLQERRNATLVALDEAGAPTDSPEGACLTMAERVTALVRRSEAALSAERDKSARLEEMHGDALNVIGNLQGLVIRVDGWVRTGCSETAAMAMQGAREDGWSQMGWKQHLSKQRALRAALRAEPEEAAS